MRITVLSAICLFCFVSGFAQSDPTLMTIGGQPVRRSEFAYLYHKNNAPGAVESLTVDEFLSKFIDYKLKVRAAREAHLDTLPSVKRIHDADRGQVAMSATIGDADRDAEARQVYAAMQHKVAQMGGWIRPAQILIRLNQRATKWQEIAAKRRVDSLYSVLQRGGDFASLAHRYSDDRESALNGGLMTWIRRGQTLKEFEDQAYSLQPGEVSRPFMSPLGWHIIRLWARQSTLPYDSLRASLVRMVDQRELRQQLVATEERFATSRQTPTETPIAESVLTPDRRNLLREYEEGLLVCAIRDRVIGHRSTQNEQKLSVYFKKHKKQYRWEQPRFKGVAFHVKSKADAKKIKALLKRASFTTWETLIRTAFNGKSEDEIPFVVGYFKVGDNALIDKAIFKQPATIVRKVEFPIAEVYGKKLKAPKTLDDVRSQVLADYQDELETEWVSALRDKYPVEINRTVLATISHE